MKATVYRGIGDKHELIPFEAGKTIAECFDFDLSNAVILKNGLIANKDDILAEGDVLLIRDIPLAPVAIAAAVVAIPLVVVGTVKTVGLVKDIQKAKQMQADAEKLSKSLKDEVKNIPYLRGAQNQIALGQTQPLILGQHLFTPYLATGTFSKIGGATGKDQFFHMVLQAGFAKTVIKELSCDDVVLKKWDTDEPQQGVYNFDSGIFYDDKNKIEVVQDGSPFTTAEFNKVIHTETPNTTIDKADSENYPVGGYVFTLPKNTMAVELCILFRGLICYASDGAKLKRTVKIYPEYKIGNGAWTRFTFNQNGTASNTFSYMSLEQMRFVARKKFSFNDVKNVSEPILVRLLCDTARYEGSARDDVSLLWIQSEKYDKEKSINNFVPEEIVGSTERALSNLVGLKIKVTESNQDKLNKINMVLQSVAKTWNGSTWSVNKKPTRNPASLLLEVLTSDTHKASQIKESEIDLDSFDELYEYCEEKGFKFDIVLTEGQTKQEVCEMILESCNAILYKSITGLMTVAIDKPKENAIALFNSQNILSIDNKKNIERKADGIKINYISRAGGYVNSSYLVMRDGQERTADSVLIELNTQGMIEYEHIVKYARNLLASELLQPKQTIIEVGKEGIYYTPLSKVLLQHDSLKVGKGNAEVKSLIVDWQDIVGLKLYEPVEYDENETNGMIIVGAQNGAHVFYSLKYTALESFTDTVELVEPIPLSASNRPQQGDILSYGLIDGEFAKITTEMLIIGSEPTEDGHRLTLVDYNEAVYETGAIPAYEPSFTTSTNFEATKPVLDGTPPPPTMDELQEVHSGINNSIESIVNGTADVGRPGQIENIRATASRDGISFYCDILSDGLKNTFGRIDWEIKASGEQWASARKISTTVFAGTYNFDRDRDGYPEKDAVGLWEVRAKAVNGYGFESEFYSAVAVVNADNYGTWIQEKPTVFNIQSANRAVNVSWQRPANSLGKEIYGLKYYEIQISKNGTNWHKPAVNKTGKDSESDWYDGTGQLRNDSANYTQSLPLTGQTLGLPENTTYYFRVRTVGETNTSDWSDTQTGIALATGIGDIIAKTVKEAQLGDSSVSNIKIQDGSIVASEKVVANSITTELLNVLAKNKINNFSITGTLEGWETTGTLEDDASGFKKLKFGAGTHQSNVFTVQPNEILSFEFGIACPNYTSKSGAFIGLTHGQSFRQYAWSFTLNKWIASSVTSNAYFISDYKATTVKYFKTYILGSKVNIADIPAPSATDTTYNIRALQLQGTDTTARLRTGFDSITAGTYWELYNPQIYSNQGGKIVAQQIVTPNLAAISAKLGEIEGDTADYKLVMGSGGSAEEGTLLLGATTDASYFRRWKEGGVWKMAIKLATLFVDAVSSKILGIFRVRNSADTATVFEVDPTIKKATVKGEAEVDGESGQGTLRIASRSVLGAQSRIHFKSSDLQNVQIRHNTYDSYRAPFGLIVERAPDNAQTTLKAFLEVEGDLIGKSDLHVTGLTTLAAVTASSLGGITPTSSVPGVSVTNGSTGHGVSVTNSSTGRGVYVDNNSDGHGVSVANSSTGRGVYVYNNSTGSGVSVANNSTGHGVYVTNSSTGRGVSVTNSSTGLGVYVTNTGSGRGVYVYNSSTGHGVYVDNDSDGLGVYVYNAGSGRGVYVDNDSDGRGVYVTNTGSGLGVYVYNSSTESGVSVDNTGSGYGLYVASGTGTGRQPAAKFTGNGIVIPYFDSGTTIYDNVGQAIDAVCPGARENGQVLIIRWLQAGTPPTQRQQIAVYANGAWR